MDGASKPVGLSDQPPQGPPKDGTSSGNVAQTDAASVLLAPATSLALSMPPERHEVPPPLPNNDGPPAAANEVPVTQAEDRRGHTQDPVVVGQLQTAPKDGAKTEQVNTAVQGPGTALQGRTRRRRRRKKRVSRKPKESTETQPNPTSRRRKKRRARRRKSKATVAAAEVIPANEQQGAGAIQPLAAADVENKAGEEAAEAAGLKTVDVGADDDEEGSGTGNTKQNARTQESEINENCPGDASYIGKDSRIALVAPPEQSEKLAPYRKWKRGSKEESPSAGSRIHGGTIIERHGTKKRLSDGRSAYSYSTLQELVLRCGARLDLRLALSQATTLKTHSTPAPLARFSLQASDKDTQHIPLLLMFAAVFGCVVALLLWLMDTRRQHAVHGVCVSAACAELSAAFNGVLNYSVDPCHDLNAFVCSKNQHRGYGTTSGGRGATSVVEQVIRDYELRMVKLFADNDTAFSASVMVSKFLQECSSYGQHYTSPSIDSFRKFFAYVSVPWPFDPPVSTHIHPLEAVLSLSLKWGVDTWFRAYVHMVHHGEEASNVSHLPGLIIEAGSLASSWLDLVRTLELTDTRQKYYRLFYARYNATLPDTANITAELAIEKDVLTTIDAARSPGIAPRVVVSTIAKIAEAVANTTLDNWLQPVQAAPGGQLANSTTMAAVRDARTLRAVQNLTNTYSTDILMRHLSWWLVQILTVIGWPQGYVVIAGSQEAARSEIKVECYRIVADRFGLLIASESAVKLFNQQSREEVTNFLRDIITLLASAVAKAPWLSSVAKDSTATMLRDLQVVVWPPDVEESNAALSELYAGFCSICGQGAESGNSTAESTIPNSTERHHLMDYWWQFSKKFWELPPEQHEYMQLLWQLHRFEALRYEPWDNRVHVSHAALSSLMYHPESAARRAANYGGLGSAFAHSVLQMFEPPKRALCHRQWHTMLVQQLESFSMKQLDTYIFLSANAISSDGGTLCYRADDFNINIVSQPLADISDLFHRAEYLNCSDEFLTNVRDIFAMGLAWQALKMEEKAGAVKTHGPNAKRRVMIAIKDDNRVDHLYSGDQLFFLTYCRSRCVAHRQLGFEHGPDCNAAVRGTADFARAFKCDVGTPMVPRNACHVADFFEAPT